MTKSTSSSNCKFKKKKSELVSVKIYNIYVYERPFSNQCNAVLLSFSFI